MTDIFSIPTSEPFDEETISFIAKCAKEGCIYEFDLDKLIQGRLEYICHENINAAKDSTDNWLIEIVAKYLRKDQTLYALVLDIAVKQCTYLAESQMKSLLVSPQDREDYFSILKIVILDNLPNYDHTQGKVVTFMSRPVMAAFRKERNPGSTRYNSGILKNIKKAISLLEAEGVTSPDAKTIADKINNALSPYRPISVVQVQNAMNNEKQMVEMDETLAGPDSPEKKVIEDEEKERLKKACDNEHWLVKNLFDVFQEYYYADNPDELIPPKKNKSGEYIGALPVPYIKKRMYEKTGVELSDVNIKNLTNTMGDIIARQGLDRGYKKKRNCPNMQVIDTFIPDAASMDRDIADVMAFDIGITVDLRLG